jgi:23S rRNA (cytosine1962-C5)-methyltransferase
MRVTLKPGRDFSVRSGHPWIFSGAIAKTEGEGSTGELVAVHAADGRLLGSGTWNASTSIAVRMLVRGPRPIDAAFVAERIGEAVRLRALVTDTDALRLVNGEGDRFPGSPPAPTV